MMLAEQNQFIADLYTEYFPKLMIYATSILNDTYRAQDVVQDTFHEAIRHYDTIAASENPGGWLMETLKNKIRDSERSRRRYMRRFLSLNTDVVEEAIPSSELLDGHLGRDETLVLQLVEETLTPEENKLLKRLVFDKAGHLQVAKEFGITVYASEKRLERVRQKLYKVFPERKQRKKK